METGTMIWIGAMLMVPLALMLVAEAKGLFKGMGGGAFKVDLEQAPPSAPGPGPALEREQEIRQLVEAKNHHRGNRGEQLLDVDHEVDRLLALDSLEAPKPDRLGDQSLRNEVRGLVLARNERLIAQGKPPLDVEAEIDRQLRDAGA